MPQAPSNLECYFCKRYCLHANAVNNNPALAAHAAVVQLILTRPYAKPFLDIFKIEVF
ncbi:conserved hypothetical protein, partial [Ricinus communis]